MKEFYENKWKQLGNWEKSRAPFFKKTPDIEAKVGLSWIKERIKSGLLLDIGCGGGRNSKLFSKSGYKVIGIDYSKTAIKLAKQLDKKSKFKAIDIFDYTFKNQFDIILDFGCFHHMNYKNRKKYYSKILKLLKPNGYFLLYTFSTKSGKTFNYSPGGKNWSYRRGIYNHYFSIKEIKDFFGKKFKIIKTKIIKEKGRKLAFNLVLMQKL